jgi:predicted DNA-binding protein (UPF0251 family)/DNA-directed RNA polymerase subunit RPC12/RpoP
MPRPVKWRRIEKLPAVPFFIPSEKGIAEVPEIIVKLEELEAVRLKDLEGLEQEECAEKMSVSRPTFQRILLSAREKIADSLVNGKVIQIEGGNFTRNICPVRCTDCGREWKESFEKIETIKNGTYACPSCGSVHVVCRRDCTDPYCHCHCSRWHIE